MTKTVENKVTSLMLDETRKVKYSDLLMIVMNKPIEQGVTIVEMRRDLRIIGAIEAAKEGSDIILEEDDLAHVIDKVEQSTWNMLSLDVLTFADYISSLK